MARTGRVADDIAFDWLDSLIERCTHIGLANADPFSVMDPLTVEPAGPVYHRAAVELVRTDSLLHNLEDLVWPGLPEGAVVTWYAGWDAAFNGNLVLAAPAPVLAFPAGGGFYVPAGEWWFGIAA